MTSTGRGQRVLRELSQKFGARRNRLDDVDQDPVRILGDEVALSEGFVAEQIASESMESGSALEAMLDGADVYFAARSVPGRARLLLLEGPAILGVPAMVEIDRRTGQNELSRVLKAVLEGADSTAVPSDALSAMLLAAFDKAALVVVSGESIDDYKAALRIPLSGIPGMNPKKS